MALGMYIHFPKFGSAAADTMAMRSMRMMGMPMFGMAMMMPSGPANISPNAPAKSTGGAFFNGNTPRFGAMGVSKFSSQPQRRLFIQA